MRVVEFILPSMDLSTSRFAEHDELCGLDKSYGKRLSWIFAWLAPWWRCTKNIGGISRARRSDLFVISLYPFRNLGIVPLVPHTKTSTYKLNCHIHPEDHRGQLQPLYATRNTAAVYVLIDRKVQGPDIAN